MERKRIIGALVVSGALALSGCGQATGPTAGQATAATVVNMAGEVEPATTNTSLTTSTAEPTSTTVPPSSEKFDRANWAVLDMDPKSHIGAEVEIVGRVFTQPEKDATGTYIQMWADPRNNAWNTLVGISDPDFNVAMDDYVLVRGVVFDEYRGQNMMGGTVIAPAIRADYMEVVDALAAAEPPDATMEVEETQDQHGIAITLHRVEFTSEETRVVITVSNGSSQEASFYSFNAKATQGDTQYEEDTPYGMDYPEVQSELLPGIKSKGVLVFPAMDPAQRSNFYFEASSDDWSLDFEPYVFIVE